VRDVTVDDKTLRCHVTGPMWPLLEAISNHKVLEMFSREPSLEELFLAHYGDATVDA
jgi:ABC-2 type transport system ATP-binding protein